MPSAPNDVTYTVWPTSGGAVKREASSSAGAAPSIDGANRAERGARFRPQFADLARRQHGRARRRAALGRLGQRLGLALEPGHDGIDLGARFAQPLVQLVVEALLEHRLALREPGFALVQRVSLLRERVASLGDAQLLLLDRRQFSDRRARDAPRAATRAPIRRARASATTAGRHAEPFGDLQGEAASRRAVDQPVRRRVRLRVEAERRRLRAVRRRRIGLQRIVMRRGDDERAAAAEVIDDGRAERAALDRIGAAADFVEQDERRQLELALDRARDSRGARRTC